MYARCVQSKLAWITGLSGLGLIVVGAALYRQQRKQLSGLGRLSLKQVDEAPVVSERNHGGIKTQLRKSNNMPIEQRLATIQRYVREGVQDGRMRKLALDITKSCPERDGLCEAKAIYDYVKRNVRYTGDIAPIAWEDGSVEGVDLYQSGARTLEFAGGDCDDQSILVATLLALNGITPRLRVMKESKRDDWSHIYPGALLPKLSGEKFIAIDTTLPGNNKFGVEVPAAETLDFPA